eukprot:gnl/MRDRNA2_/MRDRNA2_22843_c0_seq1.p1 gnl/MRDRNA2_/MRDRNA2_22843_c0~~gnl/MRDRNA2_/MRDRNA2_22843_c0_seq1.p1  ORF type:complete len:322 (+),score=68.95 gnl/MRDRNA2_/MRDRNA2_22843_c0_seq1:140-967(+)
MPGEWKWHGGVLAADGCIYGIPSNGQRVLKINTRTDEVTTIGEQLQGSQKWYGGLLGCDGCIYGIPQCADAVLKINPFTQEVTTIGTLPLGGWKWHGGVVGSDECIYGLPANADTVLKIIPRTGEVKTIGWPIKGGKRREHGKYEGKYKYLGGILVDDVIFAFPGDADFVLKIQCGTDRVSAIGRSFEDIPRCFNKWQNGVLGRDGFVYGIPLNAEHVLRIDPRSDEVTIFGDVLKGNNKWEGAVLANDGNIYCMPMTGSKRVLKIVPEYAETAL